MGAKLGQAVNVRKLLRPLLTGGTMTLFQLIAEDNGPKGSTGLSRLVRSEYSYLPKPAVASIRFQI